MPKYFYNKNGIHLENQKGGNSKITVFLDFWKKNSDFIPQLMSFRIVLHSKIPEPLEANIQEDDLSQEGIDTMPK